MRWVWIWIWITIALQVATPGELHAKPASAQAPGAPGDVAPAPSPTVSGGSEAAQRPRRWELDVGGELFVDDDDRGNGLVSDRPARAARTARATQAKGTHTPDRPAGPAIASAVA